MSKTQSVSELVSRNITLLRSVISVHLIGIEFDCTIRACNTSR